MIITGLLTTLPTKATAMDETNEDIQKIIPNNVSRDGTDTTWDLAKKNNNSATTGIAVNAATLTLYCRYSRNICLLQTPLVAEQAINYQKSQEKAERIKGQVTDNIDRITPAQLSPTSGDELENDRLNVERQNRALENALIDQELNSYVNRQARKAKRDLNRLEKQGYKYNPKTRRLTIPGGKSIAAKDIFTDKGLKQLGLSDQEIKKFKKQQKGINQKAIRQGKATIDNLIKKAKLKARRLASKTNNLTNSADQNKSKAAKSDQDEDAQNTPDSSSSASSGQWQAPDFQDITSRLGKNKRVFNEFAGLSKRYGNELIGVAEDNIFDMIHRRYIKKQSQLLP